MSEEGELNASAGALMSAEIEAQPEVLDHVLREGRDAARAAARAVAQARPRFVLLAGRGTSDHAALYAKYLVEIMLGLPAGLTSPSTYSVYGSQPDLHDAVVLAVSQSGESPDLVETVRVARSQGAMTVVVTNSVNSSLAQESEVVLDVLAGAESAVAATKSYTAELLTLWLLIDAWAGGDGSDASGVPATADHLVSLRPAVAQWATRYRFTERMVLTGRGYAFPTVLEGALKLMETTYASAHAFSGADLMHGPLAMLGPDTPVIALLPAGAGAHSMAPVIERLVQRNVDLAVIGPHSTRGSVSLGLVTPEETPEYLAPITDVIALQWLSLEMALGRGIDPDCPRALHKITETR
ncbi:MAG: SIS domain-containing protein [Actinomycetes bacterium]